MFTSLTSDGAHGRSPTSQVGVSSLMDTWLLLANIEANGERTRTLQVLKSRGMPHSNQVREFVLSERGIELVDVYMPDDRVLTGSERIAHAARAPQARRGPGRARRRSAEDRPMSTVRRSEGEEEGRPPAAEWQLRLYVAGQTPKSVAALDNLRRLCETHLAGRYEIEVIDLLVNPKLAAGDQILAVPTLVRKFPEPIRKIIGDLSNEERVLVGLDVQPDRQGASQ